MAEYQGLYVKFGANTLEFDNSVKGVNKALGLLRSEITSLNKELKLDPDNMEALAKKAVNFKEQIKLNEDNLKTLQAQLAELGTEDIGSTQWVKLTKEITRTKDNIREIGAALDYAEKHMAEVADPKSIYNLDKAFDDLGKDLELVNRRLALDPKDVNATAQKTKILAQQTEIAGQKVQTLQKEQAALGREKIGTAEWKSYDRAIEAASIDVVALKKQIDGATQDTTELKNAGDGTKSAFEGIGKVVAAIGIGAAVKKVGEAAKSATTEAVNAFADYEQLVGGVDTLFGDSSGKLQEYAANAYNTAGMSANDYMSTVTSFSASLINSLGGDTEAATEYADMAITDMADNANKMGTSIDSIQQTYQSLARGNYGMLDNLKLGYGGTKEEMERLLADAEKLPDALGKDFDINNFADVTEAIHLVQQEMGIAGATAAEAEGTITGSMSAFKSASENLVAGLGNADADIGALTDNVVDSFGTVTENILPIVKNIAEVLPEALTTAISGLKEIMPEILSAVDELIEGLMDGLSESMPDIINMGMSLLMGLAEGLIENLPEILDAALQIVLQLVKGITESIPTLIPAIIQVVMEIGNALIENLPLLLTAAVELLVALAMGLIENLPVLLEYIPQLIQGMIDGILEQLPMIIAAGAQLLIALVQNAPAIIFGLVSALPTIMQGLVNGIIENVPLMAEAGLELIKGVWEGIKNAADWLWNQVKGFFGGLLDNIKAFLGIHSPSTVFAEIGENMGAGVGVGFVAEMPAAIKKMRDAMPTAEDLEMAVMPQMSVLAGAMARGGTTINAPITNNNNFNGANNRSAAQYLRQMNRSLGLLYAR